MTYSPFPVSQLPLFSGLSPSSVQATIRTILTNHRQQLAALLAQPKPYTWENLLQPLEEMSDELNKVWSPFAHVHAVLESEEWRKAYNAILPLITQYHTELGQNAALFAAIQSIQQSAAFTQLHPAQQKIIENDCRDFKLAGIHLPADKKKRLADLQQQLSQLMTTFAEHVLDATQAWTLHVTDSQRLAGLSPQALELAANHAAKRGLSGYVFTLDYPSYSTAIKSLDDRALRQTLYEAYATRASDQGPMAGRFDNTPVMNAILSVRHEIAQLVGFAHYADYSLATKMAKKPEDVLHFLQDLLMRSKPIAQKEYQALVTLAKTRDGISQVEAWDVPYYSEKLRESLFHFTQEDIRPYFPVQQVLNGMFKLVHQLYGIEVRAEEKVDVWHPDVQFFSLYDAKQQLRAGFYVDLYARAHKRDGAWMDECRVRRRLQAEQMQYPVAYLTCNFMPPLADQPALLTHDDVLTLFHEFGHCLHHMLTQVDYPSVAGINGVAWDAVEFPSQFMENFCWEKESLDLIAAHYQTGAPLPDALFQKMVNAKHFETGLQMVRQIEFSLFDFRLHLMDDMMTVINPVQTILNQVRQETAVIPVPDFNRFQHSFSHIFAGSYGAGYYSYKWAEVLSADAYAQFEEKGIFDRATGLLFMKNILEVGGVRDPMQSFVAFRGREPTIDALLRHNGI